MKQAIYIHGLGGSGHGGSSKNVRELLKSQFDLSASTYDLLQPMQSFEQIQKDVAGKDLIIASSLGGFYASALKVDEGTKVILLNPCLKPQEAIEPLLYDDQKKIFDKEKCLKEWNEIQSCWSKKSVEEKNQYAGIFADNDEFFHYKNIFDENLKSENTNNSAMIHGNHEIAKNMVQLTDAFESAKKIWGSL